MSGVRTSDRTVVPHADRITVAEVPVESVVAGLYIPESAMDQYERGVVKEIGDKVTGLEAGMLVYYRRGQYDEIGDVRVVHVSQVLAYEHA